MESQKVFSPSTDDISRKMGVKHPMSSEPMYPPKKRALYEHKLLHGIEQYPVNSYHANPTNPFNKGNESSENKSFNYDNWHKSVKENNQLERNYDDRNDTKSGCENELSTVDVVKNSLLFSTTALLVGQNDIGRTHCLVRPRSDSLHSLPSISSEVSETPSTTSREPSPLGLHAMFDHQTPERNPVFGPGYQNRVISKPLFPPTNTSNISGSSDSEQSMVACEDHFSPDSKNYGEPSQPSGSKLENNEHSFKISQSTVVLHNTTTRGITPTSDLNVSRNEKVDSQHLPNFSTLHSGTSFAQCEKSHMKTVAAHANGSQPVLMAQSLSIESNMGPMISLLGKFNAQASHERQGNGTFSIVSLMKDSGSRNDKLGNENAVLNHQSLNFGSSSKNVQTNEKRSYEVMTSVDAGKENVEPFKCPECSKVFLTEEHLQQHISMHAEKALNCWVCNEAFNGTEKLLSHMKTNHQGVKPYKCQHCAREFGQYNNLRRHLRVHREKKFKCTLCDREFNEEFYLKMHMSTHTGRRAYSCGVCSATFPSSNELKVHVKTHSPSQLHTCSVCGKSFSKACVLRQHKKGHSGERPHKCEICLKTFIHRHHLTMHMRSHTDQKLFICDICHKEFAQSSHLYKHLRSHEESGELDVETRNRHSSGKSASSKCSDTSIDNSEKEIVKESANLSETDRLVHALRENDSRSFETYTKGLKLLVNQSYTTSSNVDKACLTADNRNKPDSLNSTSYTDKPKEQMPIETNRQGHENPSMKRSQTAAPSKGWVISKPKTKKKIKSENGNLSTGAEKINNVQNRTEYSERQYIPAQESHKANPPTSNPAHGNQSGNMSMTTGSDRNDQTQSLPSIAQMFGGHLRPSTQYGHHPLPNLHDSSPYRMQLPTQMSPYTFRLPYMPVSQPSPIVTDPRGPIQSFHGYDPMFHPYTHPMHVYYNQMYWMNQMSQNRMLHQSQEVKSQGQEPKGHQSNQSQDVKGQVLKEHNVYQSEEVRSHQVQHEVTGKGQEFKGHQVLQSEGAKGQHPVQEVKCKGQGFKKVTKSMQGSESLKTNVPVTFETSSDAHSNSSSLSSMEKKMDSNSVAKKVELRSEKSCEDKSTRNEVAHQLLKMSEQDAIMVPVQRPCDQYEPMTSMESSSSLAEQCAKNRNSGNATIYSSSKHLMNMYKVLPEPGKELMKLQNFVETEKAKMKAEMGLLEKEHTRHIKGDVPKQEHISQAVNTNNGQTVDNIKSEMFDRDPTAIMNFRTETIEEQSDASRNRDYFEDSLEERALQIDLESSMNDSSVPETGTEGQIDNLKDSSVMCSNENQNAVANNCVNDDDVKSMLNRKGGGLGAKTVNDSLMSVGSVVETDKSSTESDFSEEALDLSFNRKHNESVTEHYSEMLDNETNQENERPLNPTPRTAQTKYLYERMVDNSFIGNEKIKDEDGMRGILQSSSIEIAGVQCQMCSKTFVEAADLHWHMLHHMKVKGQGHVSPEFKGQNSSSPELKGRGQSSPGVKSQRRISPELKGQGHNLISERVKGQNLGHVKNKPEPPKVTNYDQYRGQLSSQYARKAVSTVFGEISPNKKVSHKSPRKSLSGSLKNRENVVRKSPRKSNGQLPFIRNENVPNGENVSPKWARIQENAFSAW